MAFVNLRPDRNDTQQLLLRKLLAAINLWAGGITSDQAQNIQIDTSGGLGTVTVTPPSGSASSADRVGGFTTLTHTTPVIPGSAAYAAGDTVGTPQALTVLRSTINTGVFQSLTIVDTAAQAAAYDILVFNGNPSSSTFTDNNAAVIAAADVSKLVAKVSVTSEDYLTAGGVSVATVSNIGAVVGGSVNGVLYFVPITQGTPTYSANGVDFFWGILQD